MGRDSYVGVYCSIIVANIISADDTWMVQAISCILYIVFVCALSVERKYAI